MLEPDPMAKWSPAPDWRTARLVRGDWQAAAVTGLWLTRLSGDLDAVFAKLDRQPASVGLWEIADPDYAAIRIGRDRAVLVSTAPVALALGWHPEGFAVSDASDSYIVMGFSGEGVRALIAEATSADFETGSPSASILFAAVPALLYRTGESEARLHVEASLAPFLWRWLETR